MSFSIRSGFQAHLASSLLARQSATPLQGASWAALKQEKDIIHLAGVLGTEAPPTVQVMQARINVFAGWI